LGPEARSVAQRLEGIVFIVKQAITVAALFVFKMAVPVGFKTQKGYYFDRLVTEEQLQLINGGKCTTLRDWCSFLIIMFVIVINVLTLLFRHCIGRMPGTWRRRRSVTWGVM